MSETLTLREFVEQAKVELDAFVDSTIEHAMVDKSFYLERDLDDWRRELIAYQMIVEIEEPA